MQTKEFAVNDYLELRVMQRIFREAKFCREADDDEIATSPIVADLFERLLDALISTQVERDGEVARVKWENWLSMEDASRDEWGAAFRRAVRYESWDKLTSSEKIKYVEVLFRPFLLKDDLVFRFIAEVDAIRFQAKRGS